jgi:low temperature requirement protein LtrA
MTVSQGRKLIGAPILLQDWDREAEEGAAKYWELFLDLLLVAAASSVADQFEENLNFDGFLEFTVFYLITINGWMLYTHHISTRFEDSSLTHSLVLFAYLIGFGACIVNTGFENASSFAAGALIQRGSVLVMLATVSYNINRARYFCGVLAIVTGLAMVGFSVALVAREDNESMVRTGLWIAAFIESSTELFMIGLIDMNRLIPINIEQSKERLGALELIVLGETVSSVTNTYRELRSKERVATTEEAMYYWLLGLSFLLIFMFTLLYFHMQPAPDGHAFRRSRLHGTILFVAHKVLGLALLTVGVSVKLVVRSVVVNEEMSPFASRLMGIGVGGALALLLLMRYLHYGGRTTFSFGHNMMFRWGDRFDLDRIASIWWFTMGVAWLLPFWGIATGVTTGDPLISTALHAGLLFVLCIAESTFTHMIIEGLQDRSSLGNDAREGEVLTASHSGPTYQGAV